LMLGVVSVFPMTVRFDRLVPIDAKVWTDMNGKWTKGSCEEVWRRKRRT